MSMMFGSADAARAAAMQRPATQAQSAPEIAPKDYIMSIANAGPEAIKTYSTLLARTPYYRGKPVTKLTPALIKAIGLMEEARASLKDYRGEIPRDQFIVESIGEGTGTKGGPTSTVQTRVSTPLEGRTLIN
jgi:hypothetical protein